MGQGVLLIAIAVLIFSFLLRIPTPDQSVVGVLERLSFDLQTKFLRTFFPRPARVDPVLIGIDEKTEAVFDEPLAMWHKHLANTLHALAVAQPKLVGVDIVLPPKSFDKFQPGGDFALVIGLGKLKNVAPLVFVHSVDRTGKVLPIHEPFLRVLGDDAFGIDKHIEDRDRIARRYNEGELLVKDAEFPTFVGNIARRLGREPGAGYIDFTTGNVLRYIPIQQVNEWLTLGDIDVLRREFSGKIVLIGNVSESRDRWTLPVALSDWERKNSGEPRVEQPGVVLHLQALRSVLGDGLIVPISNWLKWAICGLLLLVVFLPSNWKTYLVAFAVAPLALFVGSAMLMSAKILIPAITFLILLWIAVMVGAVADGMNTLMVKNRLRNAFEGSVSPPVLQEMLSGNIASGISAKTAEICVLFSDIRGFTGISETLSPEAVTGLLTRYFDRMVDSVHRCGGTMDKFMGDGMMVLFGVPKTDPDPCGNAVRCAFDMVQQLSQLNAEFAEEGLPPIAIGIGINYGKVVVGNIGSTARHNYSAIGDAVNVASRVEGLTKRLGQAIVFTDSVKERLGTGFEMVDYGVQAIRGHSPMRLWGVSAVTGKNGPAS